MSKRIILAATLTAAALVVVVSGAYVLAFGVAPTTSHEKWGQFGDYFGGILNPLFALLAFLAVLWSIAIQDREFRAATYRVSEQAEFARLEQRRMHDDRIAQELLHVVKDIDLRLELLLRTDVSPSHTQPRLTIALMFAEAERIATSDGTSSALDSFVVQARTPGSLVEAPVREITYLVGTMREFLERYSSLKAGSYAPAIVYYAEKYALALHLLEYIGAVKDDTRRFFATIGDGHG